jgi:hypothetical protein
MWQEAATKKPSDLDVESIILLEHSLIGMTAWNALIWLRIGSGLLCMR